MAQTNTTLILAAKDYMANATYNDQMFPIRGKPSLAWVMEDFYEKDNVIVVLDKNNEITQKYLNKHYPLVRKVLIDINDELEKRKSFSILSSLLAGLSAVSSPNGNLKLILGDTLCRGYEKYTGNSILISSDFSSSERWCLIEKDDNNFITDFFDKKTGLDIKNKYAVVGQYQFTDIEFLHKLTQNALDNRKRQLSDILQDYKKEHPLKAIHTQVWFDLGHKAGIIKAQNYLFNSRDFNNLYADPIAGTITKISSKRQKLEDEYEWYKNLPDKLKILAPRPVEFKENINNAVLTMEIYGYPALSELFILGNLDIEEWELIIERLFQIHQLFEDYTANMDKENFYDLYLHKTWQRLKELQGQNPYWQHLWKYEHIIINGVKYKNIRFFETRLNQAIEELIATVKPTVMHGDYCFSNILFDTNSFLCKVVDPRGRMKEQTIYGDPRYDIAKLRHSVVGGYDYAVHGLFNLSEDRNEFGISDNYPHFQSDLTIYFDKLTEKFGYKLFEIKLIEALLFMSMIPLHKDSIERQKIFYLKAIKKINELFTGEKDD